MSEACSLAEVLKESFEKYGNLPCFGTRTVLDRKFENVNNKRTEYISQGEYVWKTYSEVNSIINTLAEKLAGIVEPGNDNIAIYSETREEWQCVFQACLRAGITTTTIYTTLLNTGVAHVLDEVKPKVIFLSQSMLPKISEILSLTDFKDFELVYFEDHLSPLHEISDIKITSYNELVSSVAATKGLLRATDLEDVVLIMYTSGSTGVPKGVLLTNKNLISSVLIAQRGMILYGAQSSWISVSYLPLAHIAELQSETGLLLIGVGLGFSSPFTLFDTSSKVASGTKGDCSILKPHVFNSVPLVLERIMRGVLEKVSKSSYLKKSIFQLAFKRRKNQLKHSTDFHGSLNQVVFGKVKAIFGGNVRIGCIGGALVSPGCIDFITVCTGLKLVQCYGLTESSGVVIMNETKKHMTDSVGSIVSPNEFKLIDWEDGGYKTTDKPKPRGELVLSGSSICKGYFNLENTFEQVTHTDENGTLWFSTGDIVSYDEEEKIFRIIDRKKDLAKLSTGEYVSLGTIETVLKTNPIVENACAIAEPSKSFVVALIVPNPDELRQLSVQSNTENKDDSDKTLEELCSSTSITEKYLNLLTQNIRSQLDKYSIPQKICLIADTWLPHTGLVTASMKLKRTAIRDKYASQIGMLLA